MRKIQVIVFTLLSVAVLLSAVNSFAACTVQHLVEDSTSNAHYVFGQSWTATCDGTLQSITVKADNPAAGTHVLSIYSGQSFAAGDLLTQQGGITLADGENTIDIIAMVTITNGQQYTFTIDNDLNNALRLRYDSANGYSGGEMHNPTIFIPNLDLWFQVNIVSPEINLKQGVTDIADGGSYDFGSQNVGTATDITFTVENADTGNLTITTPITIAGEDAGEFSVEQQPVSPVAPSGTTTFIIRFSPTSTGAKTASLSIANNDSDENPYDFTITGSVGESLTLAKDGTGTGTITSTPSGIDCGPTCSAYFSGGTAITLTATPDLGSAFDGFSGGGCLGNGECTVLLDQASTITATFNSDGDSDGISDVMEDAGPNGGDGNRDGVPDSVQANVATFRTINGDYVTLISETGSELKDVVATVNPSPNDSPGWASFPKGFFGFKVSGLTPGQETTVSLVLHQIQAITTYHKYGPTPDNLTDHWYRFFSDGATGARIVQTPYQTTIFLDFIDGQRGDDDLLANGEIADLGAPTIPEYTGDGGCFVSSAASRPGMIK